MEEEWQHSQSSKQTAQVQSIRRVTRSVAKKEKQMSSMNSSELDPQASSLNPQIGITRKLISKQTDTRKGNSTQSRNTLDFQQKKIQSLFPGQSKNFLKNTLHRLKEHIDQNFDLDKLYHEGKIKLEDRSIIRSFQHWDQQKYTRTQLYKLNQSSLGRQICSRFFGNYSYTISLIRFNKTDLDMYFKANKKHFSTYSNEITEDRTFKNGQSIEFLDYSEQYNENDQYDWP